MTKKTTTEFDEATHTYRIGGFVCPSVTQIIGDLLPGFKADPWYLERGSANHSCYQMLALGQEFTPDERSQPNIDAWHLWQKSMMPFTFKQVEMQVFSKKYMFAGTLDAIIEKDGELLIIDYKESLSYSDCYQLGAYSIALKEYGIKVKKGFGVGLSKGKCKMSEVYDLNVYGQKFLTLLSAYNIRVEHGKTEQQQTGAKK